MMNCLDALNKIDEIADNFSGNKFNQEINNTPELLSHLSECSSCKNYYIFLGNLSGIKAEEAEPNTEFVLKVMDRISEKRSMVPILSFLKLKVILTGLILFLFMLFYGPKIISIKNGKMRIAEFSLYYPDAKTVALAGNFNDWEKESLFLKSKKGLWKLKIKLPRGKYEYVYIIDGKKIMPDSTKENIPDGFGGVNSLLEV
ncbi:MAG: glycogen-binding domain-containing protein [Bacteroidota bacterium]